MVPVEISLLDETCRTKAEYNTHESFTTFAREFSFSAYSKGKDYRVTAEPCKPLKWKETMMKTDTFQLEIKNQTLKKQLSRNSPASTLELFFGLPPSELASFKSDFDQFRHI